MMAVIGSVVADGGCGWQCCDRLWLLKAVLWQMVVVVGSVAVDCGCC